MIRSAFALLISFAASTEAFGQAITTQTPPTSAHIEKAMRVVELVLPPGQREALFRAVIDGVTSGMIGGMLDADPDLKNAFETLPELKPVFERFVERQRNLALKDIRDNMPDLVLAYANAYAHQFSPEELDEIASFLASPTGAKYTQRSAALVSDPAILAWQRRISSVGQARKSAELKRLMDELMPLLKSNEPEKRHGT